MSQWQTQRVLAVSATCAKQVHVQTWLTRARVHVHLFYVPMDKVESAGLSADLRVVDCAEIDLQE